MVRILALQYLMSVELKLNLGTLYNVESATIGSPDEFMVFFIFPASTNY
jgi:hypothetical protein